jgi:hypothetical protein
MRLWAILFLAGCSSAEPATLQIAVKAKCFFLLFWVGLVTVNRNLSYRVDEVYALIHNSYNDDGVISPLDKL